MGKMTYTRVCADCGKVMHNVGCRRQRCDACAHEYNLRVGREKRAEQKAIVQSTNNRQMLLADNARFIASVGSYGKGRLKEYLAAQKEEPARVTSTDKLKE